MEETFLMGSWEGTPLAPTVGSCLEEALLQEEAGLVLVVGDLPGHLCRLPGQTGLSLNSLQEFIQQE